MNNRVCNDPGNYTFISNTGKSLVDYVLVSPSILDYFVILKSERLTYCLIIVQLVSI